MKSMKVISVNKPVGTMTVMWDNDPDMEWNYYIPLWHGVPMEGDALVRHLVSQAHSSVKRVLRIRAEIAARSNANFSAHNNLRRKVFDVEEISKEYEEAIGD